MRILVTGATGFIGGHVVPRLRAAGHTVVTTDRLPPREHDPDFVPGDIRDPRVLARVVPGCDAVLHLAAAHHDFGIAPDTYHGVNVEGTQRLLEAMSAAGVNRLAFTSSAAVYGAQGGIRTEVTPPAPVTPYGRTKLEAENTIRRWADEQPMARAVLIVRPTVVFGPANFANMFTLIRQIDRGRFAFVGDGMNHKSLAYVGNLVTMLLARWPDGTPPGVTLLNYADTPDLTSREIATAVYRALGRSTPAWTIPMAAARVAAIPFDLLTAVTGRDVGLSSARLAKFASAETRLASTVLETEGYRPLVPLTDAIGEMVAWYLARGRVGPEPPRLPPTMPEPTA